MIIQRENEGIFEFKDQWKRPYKFQLTSFPCPAGTCIRAEEVNSENDGFEFSELCEFEEDFGVALKRLKAKVRKRVQTVCVTKKPGGNYEIGAHQKLLGQIRYNDNLEDTEFEKILLIDGKRVTIEDFARMISPYEGFEFEFKIPKGQ